MGKRPITLIAAIIFAVMTLAHIYRLMTHFQIIVGSHTIPMSASYAGLVVAGGLSWMLCREARGTRGP